MGGGEIISPELESESPLMAQNSSFVCVYECLSVDHTTFELIDPRRHLSSQSSHPSMGARDQFMGSLRMTGETIKRHDQNG